MTAGFQVRDRGAVVVHHLGEGALASPRLLATGHQTGTKSTPQLQHTRRFTGHFRTLPARLTDCWRALVKPSKRGSNLVRHP
jgi:hypothetical protein